MERGSNGFEDFYQAERATLLRAVAFALGDLDLGAEATDEAMARAYERWGDVGSMANPSGWVYRVAVTSGTTAPGAERSNGDARSRSTETGPTATARRSARRGPVRLVRRLRPGAPASGGAQPNGRKASTMRARQAVSSGLWWSSGERPRRTTIRSSGGHSINDWPS